MQAVRLQKILGCLCSDSNWATEQLPKEAKSWASRQRQREPPAEASWDMFPFGNLVQYNYYPIKCNMPCCYNMVCRCCCEHGYWQSKKNKGDPPQTQMSHHRMLSLQHDSEKIRSVLGFFVLLALFTFCIFPHTTVLHKVGMILSQCRHSGATNCTGLPAVTFLYLCYKSDCWPISSLETETMAVLCLAKDTQFMSVLITEVNYIKTLYYM